MWLIKSRKTEQAGHELKRHLCRGLWLENLKNKACFGDLSADGRIILKWILNRMTGYALYLSGSG
jgi:hypothetical protein